MSVLRLEGTIDQIYDGIWSIEIGGVNLFDAITETFGTGGGTKPVTIAIADERFTGDLTAWEGMQGYSEYTPAEPPELMVGYHNIWQKLQAMEGERLTLWISTHPINLLDP